MSMYGKYPKVEVNGKLVEQNGIDGAPKAWPTTDCSGDKIRTVQAPREQVNINNIVKKMLAGKMPDLRQGGAFEDVSQYDGLAEAIIKVQNAKNLFMTLPANIRERFENDEVQLVEFLADPNNRLEAEELGLVEPKIVEKPKNDPVEGQPAQ